MSINSSSPFTRPENLPPDKIQDKIRELQTELAGVKRKISHIYVSKARLTLVPSIPFLTRAYVGIADLINSAKIGYYSFKEKRITSQITDLKQLPQMQTIKRVSQNAGITHPTASTEVATPLVPLESIFADAETMFDDVTFPSRPKVESQTPTEVAPTTPKATTDSTNIPLLEKPKTRTFEELQKALSSDPFLSDRITIRNELRALARETKGNPTLENEIKSTLSKQEKFINDQILLKYNVLLESKDLYKDARKLKGNERTEILNNKNCDDKSVRKELEKVRLEVAAKDVAGNIKDGKTLATKQGPVLLAECLLARSKSVLPADVLFEGIFLELLNSDPKQQETLLNFCADWVVRNRNTTEFPKAKAQLELISESLGLPADASSRLKNELTADVSSTPPPQFEENKLGMSLSSIFDELRGSRLGSKEEYKKAVIAVANDLFTIDSANYERLHSGDLASSKWEGGTSPEMKQITNFSTQLTRFVQYTILSDNDKVKQARLVKFFINVAEVCKYNNDAQGLKAILAAINGITNVTIPDEPYGRKLKEANDLMTDASGTKAARDLYVQNRKENLATVPFLGTFLTDATVLEEQAPLILNNNQEDTCNYSKLVKLEEVSQNLLGNQLGMSVSTLQTDLYSRITEQNISVQDLDLRKYDLRAREALDALSDKEKAFYELIMSGTYQGKAYEDPKFNEKIYEAVRSRNTLNKHRATMEAEAEFDSLKTSIKSILEVLPQDAQLESVRSATNSFTGAIINNAPGHFLKLLKSIDSVLKVSKDEYTNLMLPKMRSHLANSKLMDLTHVDDEITKIKASIDRPEPQQ